MKRKHVHAILIILSVVFALLLAWDWIKNGTFVIGRGNWIPSFLICVGAIGVVLGWFRYFDTEKK